MVYNMPSIMENGVDLLTYWPIDLMSKHGFDLLTSFAAWLWPAEQFCIMALTEVVVWRGALRTAMLVAGCGFFCWRVAEALELKWHSPCMSYYISVHFVTIQYLSNSKELLKTHPHLCIIFMICVSACVCSAAQLSFSLGAFLGRSLLDHFLGCSPLWDSED